MGKTLSELALRSRTGASVVGMVREEAFYPNLPAGFRLAARTPEDPEASPHGNPAY